MRASLPDNFCPAPFIQLFFDAFGDLHPCCEMSYPLGSLKTSGIASLWNGDRMQALRREFLEGRVETCARQVRHKKCHLSFENMLGELELSAVQSAPPRLLDLMINGRCNLECVMCHVWEGPNGVYDASSFWTEGEKTIFPHLRVISTKSGEPFIQKDTYRLIEAVSRVNPECLWMFTTNGNYRLSRSIVDALEKIKIGSIILSIDSLDPATYADIRRKGSLEKALETLDAFTRYQKMREADGRPFKIAMNVVIQRKNWREVPELVDFCERRRIGARFLHAFAPDEVSLSTLPARDRLETLEFYLSLVERRPDLYRHIHTLISPLLDSFAEVELREPRLRLYAALSRCR